MENLNELLRRACKGDKDAFGQIYKIYFKKIYRYCRINLSNEAQAEDVAQETFLRAWRSLPTFSFGNGGSIQAFLFKIARNLMIDLSRKRQELPLEQALQVPSNEDFEEMVDRQVEIARLQKALWKLEEDERHLVTLRFFEEMPNAQIAEIMDLNEGTLRVRLHRLLKKLKEILHG